MGLRRWFNALFRPWANPDQPQDGPHRCAPPSWGNVGDRYRCPECGQRWVWQRTLFSSTPYYRTVAAEWPEIGTRKVHVGNNDEYSYHWTRDEGGD